jgi:tetratricopeptide (TPR) repeat protein
VGANDLAKLQMNLIVGLAEDQMGHSDRADAAFRRAMTANDRLPAPDPAAAYQYVEFLERNGRLDEADALSRNILKRSPHFGPARVVYAKALARHGDLRGAALEAEQALTEIGDDPEPVRTVHYFLAKTWLQLKEPSKAQPHQDWLARHAE